ncbi:MAG: hypothetical protein SFY56_07755 [Bacteroidota bacterium]|nr:hypothetical protein [Bacteroidota bacterium]
MYTVFYSWQSDLTSKYNRNFIEDAIKKGFKSLKKSKDFNIELNLERDTKDTSGTPDIVATIFNKIANSHIFICDISIINSESNNRKTPNPNVLIELGYAASLIGWDNVICVFNTAYGKVEDLPFDLKFRRPIQYFYNETSESKDSESLVKQIESALKLCHPELIEQKREIRSLYRYESDKAQRIAIEKPEYWEFKLCEELFLSKLIPINQKYEELEHGTLFKKNRYLNNDEFIDFISIEMGHIGNSVRAIMKIFSNDLIQTIGPPGQPGNAIEMYKVVKKIITLADNLVEWEADIRSLSVSEIFTELQSLHFGLTNQIISALNSAPIQMRNIYTNPNSKEVHKMEIVFDLPEKKVERINEIIAYYTKNPKLLL